MSKRNQNFNVSLVDEDDQIQVVVDGDSIGYIQEENKNFMGFVGDKRIISDTSSTDEALRAILANYNLYR